ncbi:MAG: VWA domain-containing protein [Anaerolineae bacterium]|nr:VWA domain-containing protein [Anaerolineae bacterium]
MEFQWLEMLWLLLAVPALIAAYILAQRRRQKYALRYASISLLKEALGRGPGWRRHLPPAIFLLGLIVMILALARPNAIMVLPTQQGTIILTFDVSGSMRAEDVKPNRLEAAKVAARAFVEKQPPNVRIGVVAFSDTAAIVQLPTNDREAVLSAIARLQPQRGTAIGRGILMSLDALVDTPPQLALGAPRRDERMESLILPTPTPTPTPLPRGEYAPAVVILLSDGESNVGPPPLEVVHHAEDRGVRIFTVGLGTPEGVIINAGGRNIRVRIDEPTLQKIAERTNGRYFRAENADDLKSVYEGLSMRLTFKTERTELTALFTAAATVLMLMAGTLSMWWFNRLP